MWKKAGMIVLGVGALPVVGLVAAVLTARPPVYEVDKPDLHASTDPAVIAQGEALVWGSAHCGSCHGAPVGEGKDWRLPRGDRVPLTGGAPFELPFGAFHPPNLTPHPTTGIGRYDDPTVARVIRYGVRPDGTQAGWMGQPDLADDDLVAILSYLRSLEPVERAVPERTLNPIGNALVAWMLRPPPVTAPAPAAAPPPGPTVERGRYLAHAQAKCAGCHSPEVAPFEPGEPWLSGGSPMPDHLDPSVSHTPPDLRVSRPGSRFTGWTEESFIARVRAGAAIPGSVMPWERYAELPDDDLRAIWRYLKTLE